MHHRLQLAQSPDCTQGSTHLKPYPFSSAIHTLVIAAVGDLDTQVSSRATKFVDKSLFQLKKRAKISLERVLTKALDPKSDANLSDIRPDT